MVVVVVGVVIAVVIAVLVTDVIVAVAFAFVIVIVSVNQGLENLPEARLSLGGRMEGNKLGGVRGGKERKR